MDQAGVCTNRKVGNAYLASSTHPLSPKVSKAHHLEIWHKPTFQSIEVILRLMCFSLETYCCLGRRFGLKNWQISMQAIPKVTHAPSLFPEHPDRSCGFSDPFPIHSLGYSQNRCPFSSLLRIILYFSVVNLFCLVY